MSGKDVQKEFRLTKSYIVLSIASRNDNSDLKDPIERIMLAYW